MVNISSISIGGIVRRWTSSSSLLLLVLVVVVVVAAVTVASPAATRVSSAAAVAVAATEKHNIRSGTTTTTTMIQPTTAEHTTTTTTARRRRVKPAAAEQVQVQEVQQLQVPPVGQQTTQQRVQQPPPQVRRRGLIRNGTIAELVQVGIHYEPDADHPMGYTDHVWDLYLRPESIIIDDAETDHYEDHHESESESDHQDASTNLLLEEQQHYYDSSSSPIQQQFVEIVNGNAFIDSKRVQSGDMVQINEDLIFMDGTLYLPREANVEFYHRNHDGTTVDVGGRRNDGDGDTTTTTSSTGQRRRQRNIEQRRGRRRRRRLGLDKPASYGTLTTLVLRVVDSKNVGPIGLREDEEGHDDGANFLGQEIIDVAKLQNDVFTDDTSLKTQYELCSHQQLIIEPYSGTTSMGKVITGGVTELHLGNNFVAMDAQRTDLQDAAFEAAAEQIGDLETEFDLILMCMPPGSVDKNGKAWLAYAFTGYGVSFYNNHWCASVSAHMHEVGHNLGLQHSGAPDGNNNPLDYNDITGMMGSSYNNDDTKMCFNPAKNWQLGWYRDQNKQINPLSELGKFGKKQYTINGVVDYGGNENGLIVLQLVQTNTNMNEPYSEFVGQENYFIGFNRASSFNIDTATDRDRITIIRKEGPSNEIGQSWKVAALSLGESYTIQNYNDQQGRNVEVQYIGLTNDDANDGRDATIEVRDLSTYVSPPPKCTASNHENCKSYTVTMKTDDYETDNAWSLTEKGGIGLLHVASPSSGYTEKEHVYTEEIFLPYDKCYIYTITDSYGDGICCSQGDGGFKIEDENNIAVISGGTYNNDNDNTEWLVKKVEFCSGPQPNRHKETVVADEGASSAEVCVNKKPKKFRYRRDNRKLNCKQIQRKDMCRDLYTGPNKNWNQGKRLWWVCPSSCNKCEKVNKIKQKNRTEQR